MNVFLGIGIAWTMAAVYWESQGKTFDVPVGRYVSLNFRAKYLATLSFRAENDTSKYNLNFRAKIISLHNYSEFEFSRQNDIIS